MGVGVFVALALTGIVALGFCFAMLYAIDSRARQVISQLPRDEASVVPKSR